MKKWIRRACYACVFLFLGIITFGKRMNTPDMENSIPQDSWLWFWGKDAQLGDVVLVQNPLDPQNQRLLRVLATEGQQIAFYRDGFSIDGERLHLTDMGEINLERRRWKESYYTEAGTEISWLIQRPNQASSWEMKELEVPKGHIFVVCDNRSECLDSRWWGSIPKELIIGTLKIQVSKRDPWHSLIKIYSWQEE